MVQSLHGLRIEAENCKSDSNESGALSPFIALISIDDESHKSILARIKANKAESLGVPSTEIVAIGRFQTVTPSNESDALRDTLPWQFELRKLEEQSGKIQTNLNNKPEGWRIPSNGKVLSKQIIELNAPNGKERVELTRRYFPNETKISIPYSSGQAEYLVRVKNVDEFARIGQSPYAYQLIVAEVCERPQDCRPVSWIINFRDEDGDKIFETYGGTILPPAWAK